jgi:hypothetical protein
LNGLPDLERELLGIAVDPRLKDTRPVAWDEIPQLVWYPTWRHQVTEQVGAIQDATVADAAALCREPQTLGRALVFPPNLLPNMVQRCNEAQRVIGIALAVALVDAGWRMEGDPGDPITCARGAERLEPMTMTAKFASGDVSPQAWREYCDGLGISALRLAPAKRPNVAGAAGG